MIEKIVDSDNCMRYNPYMDATPFLERIAAVLNHHGLDAVLIGNAAAALRGAPVTTVDFDFVIHSTRLNVEKLKRIANELGLPLHRPYYPASKLYRIGGTEYGLQLDFMPPVSGLQKFESLKAHSTEVRFGHSWIQVADLRDVIRGKKAANRPKDIAALPALEATLAEQEDQEED